MIQTKILGTGRAVPGQVLTNFDLEKIVETSDAWITERTGIKERRILEKDRATSDLAAEAGLAACEAAGISPKEIDCILVGTVTPDVPMPATAVYVQRRMGVPPCAAFDLSAACAGFLYGLTIGDAFVKNRQFKRVLVIGVEILSRILDWKDRNTCVLFGDGAGAVVLGPSEQAPGERLRGILSTHIYADGTGAEALSIPAGGSRNPTSATTLADNLHCVKMNGKTVFTNAVRNISASCMVALETNNMTAPEVDMVVAHQANLRILEGVSQRCGLPLEKFYLNIHKYGNTSSASIPIALDEAVREGKIKPGMLLLFCALGAGFSWGSALVRW
ncbi:MAG: ketoacyl-ACP synthase III [Deltaproteobacteria bacterium]|nr:ketoacyl-ACP synthase III [Deltaproteobacteria bacterium]